MLIEKELFENPEFQKELLKGKLGPCVERKGKYYHLFSINSKNDPNVKVEIKIEQFLHNGLPYVTIVADKDLTGFHFNYGYELEELSDTFKFYSDVIAGLAKLKNKLLVKGGD